MTKKRRKVAIPEVPEEDIVVHFAEGASEILTAMARKFGRTPKEILTIGLNLAELLLDAEKKGHLYLLAVDSAGNARMTPLQMPPRYQ